MRLFALCTVLYVTSQAILTVTAHEKFGEVKQTPAQDRHGHSMTEMLRMKILKKIHKKFGDLPHIPKPPPMPMHLLPLLEKYPHFVPIPNYIPIPPPPYQPPPYVPPPYAPPPHIPPPYVPHPRPYCPPAYK